MFVTLGGFLLVLDDLEEDENEQYDTETIVAHALRSVLVKAKISSSVGGLTKTGPTYLRNVGLHRVRTGSVHTSV
jgi:hypothetical protein